MKKRRYSRQRSLKDLSRREGGQTPRAKILIVCEGEKTEPVYFRSLCRELRLSTVEVEICGKECGSAPISVVNYTIERRQKQQQVELAFDEAWSVFDVDKHSSLSAALDKAASNRLRIALSNPCFEYWILLHFEDTDRSFLNPDKLISYLRNYHPDYKKGVDCVRTIMPQLEVALIRARNFEKNRLPNTGVNKKNSSTDVHLLVERLREIAAKPYA